MKTGTLITGIAVGGLLGAAAAMAVNGDFNAESVRQFGRTAARGARKIGIHI